LFVVFFFSFPIPFLLEKEEEEEELAILVGSKCCIERIGACNCWMSALFYSCILFHLLLLVCEVSWLLPFYFLALFSFALYFFKGRAVMEKKKKKRKKKKEEGWFAQAHTFKFVSQEPVQRACPLDCTPRQETRLSWLDKVIAGSVESPLVKAESQPMA